LHVGFELEGPFAVRRDLVEGFVPDGVDDATLGGRALGDVSEVVAIDACAQGPNGVVAE
jgi:hypothetical protein